MQKVRKRARTVWLIIWPLFIVTYLLGGLFLTARTLPSILSGTATLKHAKQLILTDPRAASRQFTEASTKLKQSIDTYKQSGPLLLLAPLPPYRWQVRLTKASAYLADAGTDISMILADYPAFEPSTDISALLSSNSTSFYEWFNRNQNTIDRIESLLTKADAELSGVPSWVLLHRQQELLETQQQVQLAAQGIPKLTSALQELQSALGSTDTASHAFLVIFQNDAELRPTGGFFGSYAIVHAQGGAVKRFEFGTDIYKIDKPFAAQTKIPPPEPLKTITQYWAFRDSSVGSGFVADSSMVTADFYEKETGTRLDGIVYLDTTVLEDVLRLTGPVTLPANNQTVTADTVNRALTQAVEKDYFDTPENRAEMEPKQAINDLIPVLLYHVVQNPTVSRQLSNIVMRGVQRKSIQVWARDSELQSSIEHSLPADAPGKGNWIKIVNTNLGGLKSSRSIEQRVKISQSESPSTRELIQTVTVTRTHKGTGEWPDFDNHNTLDFYIPANAVIDSKPISIGGESKLPQHQQVEIGTQGKIMNTTVSNGSEWKRVTCWATTKVGQTTTYELRYRLPLDRTHSNYLTYIKQAGSQRETVSVFGKDYPVAGNLFLAK